MKRAPRFTTQLYSRPSPEDGQDFARLTERLRYESEILGAAVTAPRGFPTDKVTFRIGDLRIAGKTERAAVIHDFMYATGDWPKWVCDVVFYEACRSEGMSKIRAFFLRFLPVLLSKKARKAYDAHRRCTTPAARFLVASKGVKHDSVENLP